MGRNITLASQPVYNPKGFSENRALIGVGYGGVFGAGIWTQYRASGTFIVPSGVTSIRVSVWGGGGGGGFGYDSVNSAQTGGAGGGFSQKVISVTPGASYAVTVGAGGAAAPTGGTDANGSAGGTSSFGAILSATGGAGGYGNNASRPAGGTGSGGDINYTGGGGGVVLYSVRHGGPGGGSAASPLGNGYSGGDCGWASGGDEFHNGTGGGGVGGAGYTPTSYADVSFGGTCLAAGKNYQQEGVPSGLATVTTVSNSPVPSYPWSSYNTRFPGEFFAGGNGIGATYISNTTNGYTSPSKADSGPGAGGHPQLVYYFNGGSNYMMMQIAAGVCGGGGGAATYYSSGWRGAAAGAGGLFGGGGGAGGYLWNSTYGGNVWAPGAGGSGGVIVEW